MHEAISLFRCTPDRDIENFLREKAVEFSDRGLCSVYLLLNEEQFNAGRLVIEAFFTLSHKSMSADTQSMSKSSIKKYGGKKDAKTLDFVLIGQLGKYIDGAARSQIKGSEILDEAFGVIRQASELIPCKYVLVECGDEEKVQNFYRSYNFAFFQKDGLNQFTRKL